jgi:hypothetical protein
MKIQKVNVENNILIQLEKVKNHLRIRDNYDDDYLRDLIVVAIEIAENYLDDEIALKDITIEDNAISPYLIAGNNIGDIAHVKIDDVEIEYERQNYMSYSMILPSQTYGKLEIKYRAGYTPATLPYTIYQAILIKIAELFDVDRSNAVHSIVKIHTRF